MANTKVYAATKSAKERLAKGGYKKRCAKGCACGITAPKKEAGTEPAKPGASENKASS